MIRVRIAPSPTGPIHIGTARTALFNYLFAKKHGGEFWLRVEDTDKERSRPEYDKNIFDSLLWLGMEIDGEVLRQSERTDIYKKRISELIEKDLAYVSEEKEGPNREVVRFRNPGGRIKFGDLIRGEVEMDVGELGDFIIARNLNEPLYHIAVVVDDIESEITHVIRGEDHISNTPRQILLIEALGGKRPIYAHLPLILAEDRSKLSKRKHGESVSLDFYRAQGYLPEAMVNFLALLGWNPGGKEEIFSKEELVREFSLEKVQKSGAVFDVNKLDWMNGHYIRQKPVEELTELCLPFLEKAGLLENTKHRTQNTNKAQSTKYKAQNAYIQKIITLEQPRLKKISELPEKVDYFFKESEYDKELLRWKNMSDEEIVSALDKSLDILSSISGDKNLNVQDNKRSRANLNISRSELEEMFLKEIGSGDKGVLLWPLRAALTGKKASPGPFEILEILGTGEGIRRLKLAKSKLVK